MNPDAKSKSGADNTVRVGKFAIITFAAVEFVALAFLVLWLLRR